MGSRCSGREARIRLDTLAIALLLLVSACRGTKSIVDHPYVTVAGRDLLLDVYVPAAGRGPFPTILYLHGGAWRGGTKHEAVSQRLTSLLEGWAVVSPDYRLTPADPAPAAVEDAVCALRWVAAHAREFRFDLRRLVVAGYSAGGHLALLLGLLPDSLSFGDNCPAVETPRPTAVLNLAGITDVGALLEGTARRDWAVAWIDDPIARERLVSNVSPLTWVRAGVPPIVTIHGKADPVVPPDQALRLHRALKQSRVAQHLCLVPQQDHDLLGSAQVNQAMVIIGALVTRGDLPLDITSLHSAC
jgi:acetyl esterase/lipase